MNVSNIRTAKGAADWFLKDMEALAAAKSRSRVAKARKQFEDEGPFGGPAKVERNMTPRYLLDPIPHHPHNVPGAVINPTAGSVF
jgi:hypothetical protein